MAAQRYKGLAPGPTGAGTEQACQQACCAVGPAACELYQFYSPELVKAGAAAAYENREMLGAAAAAVADNADLFAGGGLFGDDASAAAPADTDALADKFGSLFGDG